ncbi:MAG: transglycosylase SLT domain-containing protein [Pseudomonadota bacterium]
MRRGLAWWPKIVCLVLCLLVGRALSANEGAGALGGIAYVQQAPQVLAAPAPREIDARDVAGLCDQAGALAAREAGLPHAVLHAITLTETGRQMEGRHRAWPWTVNMEGVGKWFATRAEAQAYVDQHFARGARSFDIGCFQINYRWHGNAFRSVEEMFDPLTNARYAAAFLSRLHGETGSWSKAAGAYHSRTPKYATRYAKRFDRILAGLIAGRGLPAADAGEYAHNMEAAGHLPEVGRADTGLPPLDAQPPAPPPAPVLGSVAAISRYQSAAPLLTQPRGGLY